MWHIGTSVGGRDTAPDYSSLVTDGCPGGTLASPNVTSLVQQEAESDTRGGEVLTGVLMGS